MKTEGVVVGAAGMKPVPRRHARSADSLLEAVDATRRDAAQRLDPRRRVLMGQHLTPASVARDLFAAGEDERFDCAILNPPYRKIRTESREREFLRAIGVETSNLYAGFLAVTARLLASGGEMVAITPRSFCNGPYFEPFRREARR